MCEPIHSEMSKIYERDGCSFCNYDTSWLSELFEKAYSGVSERRRQQITHEYENGSYVECGLCQFLHALGYDVAGIQITECKHRFEYLAYDIEYLGALVLFRESGRETEVYNAVCIRPRYGSTEAMWSYLSERWVEDINVRFTISVCNKLEPLWTGARSGGMLVSPRGDRLDWFKLFEADRMEKCRQAVLYGEGESQDVRDILHARSIDRYDAYNEEDGYYGSDEYAWRWREPPVDIYAWYFDGDEDRDLDDAYGGEEGAGDWYWIHRV